MLCRQATGGVRVDNLALLVGTSHTLLSPVHFEVSTRVGGHKDWEILGKARLCFLLTTCVLEKGWGDREVYGGACTCMLKCREVGWLHNSQVYVHGSFKGANSALVCVFVCSFWVSDSHTVQDRLLGWAIANRVWYGRTLYSYCRTRLEHRPYAYVRVICTLTDNLSYPFASCTDQSQHLLKAYKP